MATKPINTSSPSTSPSPSTPPGPIEPSSSTSAVATRIFSPIPSRAPETRAGSFSGAKTTDQLRSVLNCSLLASNLLPPRPSCELFDNFSRDNLRKSLSRRENSSVISPIPEERPQSPLMDGDDADSESSTPELSQTSQADTESALEIMSILKRLEISQAANAKKNSLSDS